MKVATWTKAVVSTAVESVTTPIANKAFAHKAYKRSKKELKAQMVDEGARLLYLDQAAEIEAALAAAEPKMEVSYTDADDQEHFVSQELTGLDLSKVTPLPDYAREHRIINAVNGTLADIFTAARGILPKKSDEEFVSEDQKLVNLLKEANDQIIAQKKLDEELKNIGEEQDERLDVLEARLLAMGLTIDDVAFAHDLTTSEGEEVS
jgi:hypothetical protein